MNLSIALILSVITGASAFAPISNNARTTATAVRMSDEAEPIVIEDMPLDDVPVIELPAMSTSLPFLTRPAVLTGKIAGDVGFDPLGFSKTQADLINYREAEVKHARLAMLAAAGWPISEVFDKKIALALNMSPLLDATDRAPSILNGGLGNVSPVYWIGILGVAAAVEFFGTSKAKSYDVSYFPGNLGFDPLGLYPEDKAGQMRMQLAEIKNGRLAMIAIFGFAIQEFVSKQGVIDETPLFFFPLAQTMKMMTNSGYIQ